MPQRDFFSFVHPSARHSLENDDGLDNPNPNSMAGVTASVVVVLVETAAAFISLIISAAAAT